MSGSRQKMRAVLLSFVMVTSVFAAGVAFSGNAAAADSSLSNSSVAADGETHNKVQQASSQQVDIDFAVTGISADNSDDTIVIDLGQDAFDITSQDTVTVTDGDGTDVTGATAESSSSDGNNEILTITVSDGGTFDSQQLTVDADLTVDASGTSSGANDVTVDVTDTNGNDQNGLVAGSLDVDNSAPTIDSVNSKDIGDVGTDLGGANDNAETEDDGTVDALEIVFNEPIDDDTVTVGDFSMDNTESVEAISTGDSVDDNTIIVDIEGATADNTAATPTIGYTQGTLADLAGNLLSDSPNPGTSDGAEPVLLSAQTSSLDSNGNVDGIDVTFSESINEPGSTGAFTLSTGTVVDLDKANDPNTVYPTASPTLGTSGISGSNAVPEVTATSGSIVGDNNDITQSSRITVLSSNGVSGTLNGDGDTQITTDIGNDGDGFDRVLAGNATEELGLIQIRDVSGGNSPLAAQTTLEMPDGITINESASDFTITTTSGNLEVTDSSVEDGGSTLALSHGGTSSESGQTIRIQGMVVDVAPDAAASQTGVREPDNDVTVGYAIDELDTSLFQVQKAGVDFEPNDDPGTFGAGTTDNTLNDDIRVTAPANLDGGIAGGSDLVINANQSNGVTFNTDFDPTTLTASGGVPGKVDTSSASLSETQLTIPVTNEFAQGESVTIDTDGSLPVDLAGDAQPSQLSVTFRTNQSTGDVAALTGSGNQIGVNRPVVDLAANDGPDDGPVDDGKQESIVVGKNSQQVAEETDGGNGLRIETTSDGQITDGSDVTITTNRSDVTFDTSFSVDNDDTSFNDAPDALEAVFTNDPSSDNGVSNINIQEDQIALTVSGDTEDDDILAVDEIPLNVAPSVEDEERVTFNVTTTPSTGTEVLSTESGSDFIELDRPDITLNADSNATVNLDADGTQKFVDPTPGANGAVSDDALVIDSDDVGGQIVSGQTITIALEDNTGVTFSQAQSVNLQDNGFTNFDNDANDDKDTDGNNIDTGDTVDIGVSDSTALSNLQADETEISFEVDTDLGADERIHVDQLYLNASDSAQNTTVSVTTNTGDNAVTTTDNKQILINQVDPSNVFVNANLAETPGDGSRLSNEFGAQGTDAADTDVTVDSSVDSSVFVEDGGSAFGEADVSLELVEQPETEDFTAADLLNTTSLTTASDGTADVNFTAPAEATTGDYIVNASTGFGGENITYTVGAGDAAAVNVTGIKDGLVDDGNANDREEAIFRVRVEDSGGNLVTDANIDFATVISGDAARSDKQVGNEGVNHLYDNYTLADGTNADSDAFTNPAQTRPNYDASSESSDAETRGEFFVALEDQTAEDVTLEIRPQSDSVASDSASVTFSEVDDVAVELNKTTAQTDDLVTANVTTLDQDRETVTVPRITIDDISSTNTTVATVDDATPSTNNQGVASTTVTAEELGSTDIEVLNNNRLASINITVEEDAPAYYTLKLSNSIADRDVHAAIISTFSTHRQSGSTALLPHSVYRYTRTHTGGQR